jgi:hypothetical protein
MMPGESMELFGQLVVDSGRDARRHGPPDRAVAFSDALSAVRRWIWAEGVFVHVPDGSPIQKLSPTIREILYAALAPAA